MTIETISSARSPLISDYLSGEEKLRSLYSFAPNVEGLEKALRVRQFTIDKRKILQKTLQSQYEGVALSDKTAENIRLLEHTNTFTITTGHQLSLFTGPLFFIYKILSVIRLCEDMAARYPLYHFVPVYWMASEDHDFAEINHFHLFHRKYEWTTDQKGAVGDFKIDGVQAIFEQLNDELPAFREAYSKSTLSEATLALVNRLFGEYGLVIVEPNQRSLKQLFTDHIKDELLHQSSSGYIQQSSQLLDEMGHKVQVHPREINLFYLDHQVRERIVRDDSGFHILNTDLHFSESDMLQLVDTHPEKFSPNVTLRPVYQEVILPNIAYVGGPGELAYWLQLKANFDRMKVFFPALILRDSFLIVNSSMQKQMNKLGLTTADLFKDLGVLKKELVQRLSGEPFSAHVEMDRIDEVLQQMKGRIADQTLHGALEAEAQKIRKGLENLEKRVQKADERQHEQALQQLENLKSKLFPDGAPQERVDNVLNFMINDEGFITNVYAHCDPLNTDVKVMLL